MLYEIVCILRDMSVLFCIQEEMVAIMINLIGGQCNVLFVEKYQCNVLKS